MTNEDGLRIVGWGPFPMPGEKKRRAASRAYAERVIEARKAAREADQDRDAQLVRAAMHRADSRGVLDRWSDLDEAAKQRWRNYARDIIAKLDT